MKKNFLAATLLSALLAGCSALSIGPGATSRLAQANGTNGPGRDAADWTVLAPGIPRAGVELAAGTRLGLDRTTRD